MTSSAVDPFMRRDGPWTETRTNVKSSSISFTDDEQLWQKHENGFVDKSRDSHSNKREGQRYSLEI